MFRLVRPSVNLSVIGQKAGTTMFRNSTKLPLLIVKKQLHHHVHPQKKLLIRYYRTSTNCLAAAPKEPGYRECPKDGSGRGFYYSVGTLVLGTGAVIAYAKYDDDFRSWLKENVPGSDEFISFIMAEETSHVDYIVKRFIALKDTVVNDLTALIGSKQENAESDEQKKEKKEEKKKKKKYQDEEKAALVGSPSSAFKSLTDGESKKEPKYDEKRTSVMEGNEEKITTEPGTEKPQPQIVDTGSLDPKSLVELETMTNNAAESAINAYSKAMCLFQEHVDDVAKVVDESIDKTDPKIWKQLKQKGKEREKAVKELEANVAEAMKGINSLKAKVDDPNLPGGPEVRAKAKKNLEQVLAQIEEAKILFEKDKSSAAVSDLYWKKVLKARLHFVDELETLFPNIRLHDKKMKLTEGEFDLFILYVYQNILYYQKELSKLDTVGQAKVKSAIEKAKFGEKGAIDDVIEAETEKAVRKICLDYQKKMMMFKNKLQKEFEEMLKDGKGI